MLKKFILLSFLLCSVLFGAQSDLQSKIAKLQTLPKSERFKLMNEIKRELAKMNSQQRKKALGKLRASMHGKDNVKDLQHGQRRHSSEGLHRQNGMGEHLRQNMQNQQINPMHHQVPYENRPSVPGKQHRK